MFLHDSAVTCRALWKSWAHNLNFAFICICSYIREKEMEEEVLMQRREEEGKGRERRKALLEKEERKWKELEISLLSSIPNAGSRDAAAMAAAVRAVGGDSALEDSFARDRVSSIARHIRNAQLARRAEQVLFPLYLYFVFCDKYLLGA